MYRTASRYSNFDLARYCPNKESAACNFVLLPAVGALVVVERQDEPLLNRQHYPIYHLLLGLPVGYSPHQRNQHYHYLHLDHHGRSMSRPTRCVKQTGRLPPPTGAVTGLPSQLLPRPQLRRRRSSNIGTVRHCTPMAGPLGPTHSRCSVEHTPPAAALAAASAVQLPGGRPGPDQPCVARRTRTEHLARVPRRVAALGCWAADRGHRQLPADPPPSPRSWPIAPSWAPLRQPCASTGPGSPPPTATPACLTRPAIPVAARSSRGLTRRSAGQGRGQVAAIDWRAADLAAALAKREGTAAGHARSPTAPAP